MPRPVTDATGIMSAGNIKRYKDMHEEAEWRVDDMLVESAKTAAGDQDQKWLYRAESRSGRAEHCATTTR